MGLVSDIFYGSIRELEKIRNRFAHNYNCKNFDNIDIKKYFNKLLELNKDILNDVNVMLSKNKKISNALNQYNLPKNSLAEILEEEKIKEKYIINLIISISTAYQ